MALSQAMQKRIAQTTANKIAGSTPAVTAPNVNPQDSSDWMRDRIRQSVSQKMDNTQYGYNPFEKYTVSSRNSYITNFLNDADSFFRTVDSDINGENRFNAADFFAQRQKQAESLKRSADIASQYLDQYGDTFDEKDYDFLRNYLSTFNTNVDEVMGYYQPSVDARSGMAAYEDEYRTYQEEQAKKGQRLQIAAGILGNDPSASGIFAPAAGFLNMLGDAVTGADPRGITDKWTDQQKYYLGTLQNEDPGEARRYARSVNLGEDPLQAAVNAEQEEQRMLGEDLGALQAEIDRLNAQYDNYQYDASTFRGRMAADADLRRMEKEISDKEQYYRQVKRMQESAAMAAVSGNQDYAEKNGYVSTARAGISTEGNPMGVYSDMLYEYINGNQSVRDHVAATNKALANKGYDLMTEEEVGNYNYFYATEGKEKAEAYLDSLDEKLSQRKGEEIFQRLEGNTAREMMFGVGSGLNQFGANLQNLMNFQDDYLAPSAYQVAAGMVREDLDEVGPRLPEFLGGGSLGQVGFDLINTSANMAPSIMVSMGLGMLNPAVGKIAGTALMGGSAAGGAYQEALNSGYSKEQARMYSALVGGSEAGMEYLIGGISKLGGRLPEAAMEKILKGVDNAFARAAIELGGSMASEGFEEGLQEVLTPYFKNLTLMADERVDWNEVAYSALLGALSALPIEGPGAVRNAISGSRQMRGGMEEGRVPEAVYSNTGMARQISKDADVDVLDFDSVGNGNATIQLKDGGTADYRDIMFANEQQANQFRAVVSLPGIDTESANNALHAVMDADAGADVDSLIGIRDAYGKGYGVAQESDLAKGDSANINPQLRKTLFDIGRAQRDAQAKVVPTTRKPSTAPSKGYKKVVLEGKDTKIKPGTKQDAEVRFMDYIAENFSGTTVHVYKSKKGRDGKFYYWDSEGKRHRAPNGKYSGGEIWVDLNAGDKGEGLVLNTFAHEMYHHVKQWSPQKANELGEFIVKELGLESAENAVAEQIKKARKAGRSESYFEKFEGMTQEQARNKVEQDAWEDFIADSLETVFTRGDAAKAISDLRNENRGLFDEIKKFVDKWVSKLKEFYSDKTISQEGEMVAQLESFEKIQKLFMEAMEDAGKNFATAEVTDEKSTTPEGDAVKFCERNNVPSEFNPDGQTLEEQLASILTGAQSFDGRYLYVGKFTPEFRKIVGKHTEIKDLPIVMNYRDAYLAMESKEKGRYQGDGINYHNLGIDGMADAINSFDTPNAVMLSKKADKIELVLECVDRKGNKMLSIVALNTHTRNAQKFIEAHIVTSIYGRRNIEKYVDKARSEGRLIYDDKEESAQGISQVQYEGNINANSSETSILNPKLEVNPEKNSLRNEEADNSPRGILMRLDVKSRKLDSEKYHLSRYQERVEKLDKDEARLAEVKAEIQQLSANEKQNRKELTQLRNEERNLNTSIKGLKRDIKFAEQTDMFRKMVSDGRLLEYRAEQREAEKARIEEYRALRKEITGMDSVMSVMEDEFVRLARDYESQKIDLKTMEAEFLRLSKEYDKVERVAGDTKTLKADNAIWQREYRRLMREYETTDRKAKELEQKLIRQRNLATERVQSRQKTEIRNKIQKQADSLNKLLLKPDKKRHILEPLQGSVAAILDAINMRRSDHYIDTLTRYDRRIATEPDPVIRGNLIEEREAFEQKGDSFAGKMLALKEAYKNIRDNADPDAQGVYDEGLSDYLDEMVRKVGDTPLGKMTKEQLELVHDTLTAVQTVVSNANKAFDETRKQGITDMSHQAIVEVHNAGSSRKESTETAENIRKFGFNNMKPIYALETIGSNVMTGLFGNVRKGEDTWARNIRESKDFFQRASEKHGLKDWDLEKEYGFTASSGLDFKLNVEQIMSLYAYAKRDQARDHLRKGGIVFDPNSEKTVRNKLGLKKKLVSTDATAYNIDDVTLGEIISKLTPEQKAFVDEMQRYLSDTMGAKGNEVSMKLYGIKLFKEANYFPLHSSGAYNARVEAQGKEGEVKLKNASFTRAVTPNASNPIVLTPFLSTWAGHVDEMSMYNAFTLPLEDFYRVLNYSTVNMEGNASQSVRAAIQNAYGKAAVDYLDQLLKDLNGGARSDSTAGVVNKAISLYKKGATMESLSVVIQQPSAVVRAAAMIPYKYFIGPKVTEQNHNKTWAEMKQYAPICTIKEMGYFDTSVGKSTRDYLTGQEYNGFQEKAMALLTDSSYRDEALGKLPALADEFGWAMIWNAVKREQYDLHPNMKANDPKFLNMVAERFTDVIVHTQVYDSVLSRSANMRSKDNLMKMATAFMAEPTTTINMVSNAILQAKRGGDKRQAARTIGAAAGSLILNSMLVATVYAMRDDDEDKRLGEKYIKSLTENLVNSFNPLTYIPFLRDFNSLFQGYSVERADMAIANDLVQAWRGLSDEEKTPWEKVETFTGAVFQAFGIPAKNIMRDVKAVWNTVNTIANAEAATSTGRMVAIKEALPFGKKANDGEQMLMAIRSGDQDHIQRVFGRFENQQKAESALQSAIREEYLAGKITAEEATQLLTDNFDREDESEVYWILDEWDYTRDNDTSEGYTKMGMLMDAVESGENLDAEIQRYLDNGMDASDIKSQISKVYRKRYLEADEETRTQINGTVRNAYLKLGERDDDIDNRMNEWDFEAKYGMTYADMKTDYRNGEISERDLRDAMKFYGMRNFEIDKNIRSLNEDIAFFERFGMSLSELKDGYDDGDVSRNTLISALEFTGKTRTQAQEEVRERDIGNRLGIDYMNLDDAYKNNDISRQTFYNAMIENGATNQEADEAILGYDWLKKNAKRYPDLTISDAKKFAVKISSDLPEVTLNDYGVSIDSYIEYTKRRPECMGVDANGDGKTDSGTLRDSVFRMIDSLPISDKAKDGLALMSYSMNSIKKNAPWH